MLVGFEGSFWIVCLVRYDENRLARATEQLDDIIIELGHAIILDDEENQIRSEYRIVGSTTDIREECLIVRTDDTSTIRHHIGDIILWIVDMVLDDITSRILDIRYDSDPMSRERVEYR